MDERWERLRDTADIHCESEVLQETTLPSGRILWLVDEMCGDIYTENIYLTDSHGNDLGDDAEVTRICGLLNTPHLFPPKIPAEYVELLEVPWVRERQEASIPCHPEIIAELAAMVEGTSDEEVRKGLNHILRRVRC